MTRRSANLALARDRLNKTIEDFEPYEKKPEDNLTRAALLSRKAQAQKAYDAASRLLNNLLGTAKALDVAEAEAQVALAQAQLKAAEHDEVTLSQGPDPDAVKLADARLENAKAQLASAEAAFDHLELRAPLLVW